jgi:hypothetical protein
LEQDTQKNLGVLRFAKKHFRQIYPYKYMTQLFMRRKIIQKKQGAKAISPLACKLTLITAILLVANRVMLKKYIIISSNRVAQISVVDLRMLKQELQPSLQFMVLLLPKKLQTYRKR